MIDNYDSQYLDREYPEDAELYVKKVVIPEKPKTGLQKILYKIRSIFKTRSFSYSEGFKMPPPPLLPWL